MGYAKIIITGNLTKDPDLRFTAQQKAVCNITVAVNDAFSKTCTFWPCTFWGKQAEAVTKFFEKGKAILVEGRPGSRSYEDKEGNKRVVFEIQASGFEFIGGGSGGKESSDNQGNSGSEDENYSGNDDDAVPF